MSTAAAAAATTVATAAVDENRAQKISNPKLFLASKLGICRSWVVVVIHRLCVKWFRLHKRFRIAILQFKDQRNGTLTHTFSNCDFARTEINKKERLCKRFQIVISHKPKSMKWNIYTYVLELRFWITKINEMESWKVANFSRKFVTKNFQKPTKSGHTDWGLHPEWPRWQIPFEILWTSACLFNQLWYLQQVEWSPKPCLD